MSDFAPLTTETILVLIRKFLRDTPKLNELKRVNESTDDDIKLAVNMAISDWNTTPPLIAPASLALFPSVDWLIMASAMFILQSAGVLNYRNDMPYSDNGVSFNPWSKGPQYFNTAGMWAQMVEQKKREFKYALNVASTFGVVRSPEYLIWDWTGLFTGPQFDNQQASLAALKGTGAGTPTPAATPNRTAPFNFNKELWIADNASQIFYIEFQHNLMSEVDCKVTDSNGMDLKSKIGVKYDNGNKLTLIVQMIPDGRLSGSVIAYKI